MRYYEYCCDSCHCSFVSIMFLAMDCNATTNRGGIKKMNKENVKEPNVVILQVNDVISNPEGNVHDQTIRIEMSGGTLQECYDKTLTLYNEMCPDPLKDKGSEEGKDTKYLG